MAKCYHDLVMTSARNAVVGVRASVGEKVLFDRELNKELSRLENYYDFTRFGLGDVELYACSLCDEQLDKCIKAVGGDKAWYELELWQRDTMLTVVQSTWTKNLFEDSESLDKL